MLQVIHSRCAGLDLHKKFIIACARLCDLETGRVAEVKQRFGTLPGDLVALREWLLAQPVSHVAMESTGVLWRPVYAVLESAFAEVAVVNAQHLKRVPGRKTDVTDAQWLAQLYQVGLVRPSFVPARELRDVREMTRDRAQLAADRARVTNRIGKVLETAGVQLGNVCSDILGASGRAMIEALIAGEASGEEMAELARGRLRQKRGQLAAVLAVPLSEGQRFILRQHLLQWDHLTARLAAYDEEIARRLAPYQETLDRLAGLPGVQQHTAQVLLAEVGPDMSWFPMPGQLCSWAGVCPGQRESGGKRGSGKTRKGNRWLRSALVQAAWAATRQKDSGLRARYYALKARRGAKRAALAIAHQLLEVAWYLLSDPARVYCEPVMREREPAAVAALTRRLVKRLQDLGHQVTLEAAAEAA